MSEESWAETPGFLAQILVLRVRASGHRSRCVKPLE